MSGASRTTRILFVDDELNVLRGLRRLLHPLSGEWEMAFVPGGAAALAAMAEAPYDVIVSDMRMPGMDGAELLERVRRQYPQVVRIALSGHSEHELVLRAVGPTHQYLSKPCNPALLNTTITRACALRELLGVPRLKEIAAGLTCLPSLPGRYLELSRELRSSEPSLDRVAVIISSDVAMTAKILQLTNSEFFGLSHKVTSVDKAVRYLGLEVLRSVVFAPEVFACLDAHSPDLGLLETLWNHSIEVAVGTRQIVDAEQRSAAPAALADDAFTIGLLHDIGKLVIVHTLPEERRSILALMEAEHIPEWEAEYRTLGTSHMEIGAYLLALWGLPDPIVEAVACHHHPGRSSAPGMLPVMAVHAADAFAYVRHEPASAALDLAYLRGVGVADRITDWQVLCTVTLEERLHYERLKLIDSPGAAGE